ncbi:alanine racemase [Arthrobacter sp. ERGS1:01]|uniref:YggS family pyridoxal phosphate enzyme n=1 Tax=Arthrobacter sp. ERGS1:01 TaxID=1704044 RepID=UPI0006B596E9|nr:alanine racemase [Arthrobacter sp. ERGS1:01]ALE05476.1 alanine racemase [Arthrobacter sp. ERGS1:01]
MNTPDARSIQLEQNLAAVRDRIRRAAGNAEPTLIVVTKFHPAEDVLRLRRLGVADVGENRDQEAAAKAADVADAALRWHFIGQLQSNKARSVAQYAHSVHSIDRASLVGALGRAVAAQQDLDGRNALECFIQVDLSESAPEAPTAQGSGTRATAARGGAAPSEVPALAELIASTPGLRLAGVMAVAPLGAAPEPAFELLAGVSARVVADHPEAAAISAGMSHDLEAAIHAGATHLRVGSDILGPRPAVG